MRSSILSNTDKCLVEDCDGVYVTRVINVVTIERRDGKKIKVTESICNQCGDDQDDRLVRFIRDNL